MNYEEMNALINECIEKNLDFEQIREVLAERYNKDNYDCSEYITTVVSNFMVNKRIDPEYFGHIYNHFFDTWYTFDDYYNTYVERINENAINVNETDIEKATEYIRNGILCCAVEIGSYLLEGEFETNVSPEKLNQMSEQPHENFIKGIPLEYDEVVNFINSFIDNANQELENQELSKLQIIGVLGSDYFPETKDKKYSPTQGVDSYCIDTIDNNTGDIISKSLKEIDLENVTFSKNANKRVFEVKNNSFGYTSMNTGHWKPSVNITDKENIKEFVQNKGIQMNDITSEKENVTYR